MPFPRLLPLLPALVLALPRPAAAMPLLVSFTGSISTVHPALTSVFSPGQSASGSFQYESTTADVQAADPSFASYAGAIGATMSTATWQFGSYTATGTTGSITLTLGASHRFDASVGSTSGAAIGSHVPTGLSLDLIDSTATVFPDDSLPTDLQLADFDQVGASIFFDDGSGPVAVTSSLATLSVTPVPEPTTWGLVLAALAQGTRAARRAAAQRVSS